MKKTICSNRQLSEQDMDMAVKYRWLRGVAGNMEDDQQVWLKKRQACGSDTDCLRTLYRQRIQVLNKIYDSIPKPVI
ncbi:lysozyme inhibitor LprI family protein [Salmonella enterica]